LLSNTIVPHTFLNYIFVPKKEFQQRRIPEEVLLHEKTHVLQRHTLDILFVEILQVIFWFNPVFILIKKSIKLNHEFLADSSVLKQRLSIQNYVDLLLNYPNGSNQAVLSSPINYSLTKKRLQMMTKEFSKKRTTFKLMAILPVITIAILLFNNEIVAKEVKQPFEEIGNLEMSDSDIEEEPFVMVVKEEGESSKSNQSYFQDGVSEEKIKEYNTWVKKFRVQQKQKKGFTVSVDEVENIRGIYLAMTPAQKNQAEKFPDTLIPPPSLPTPPKAPKVEVGEKSDIPSPPPPAPPSPPKEKNGSKRAEKLLTDDGYTEILLSEERDWTEEEKLVLKEQVQKQLARKRVITVREPVNIQIEEAISGVELRQVAENARLAMEATVREAVENTRISREAALLRVEETRQLVEEARTIAMEAAGRDAAESARINREAAEKARVIALEASREAIQKAELQSRKAIKKSELAALKAEREIRKAEMEVRKKALKAGMNARKAAMKAHKAEMKAHRAEIKARKAEQRIELRERLKAEHHSPDKLIEKMAQKDAEFYHNGKKISAKKALKLVEKSDNKLSIDASTKNGTSKVILKD